MSRKKSEFLKSWGKAFEIFKAMVDAVLTAGGDDEDIANIQTNKGLMAELVAVVMRYSKKTSAIIKVSFADLLAACKQDGYCNPDFTESRWPLESVAPDEGDYEVVEHHFTDTVTLEEGLRRLAEMAEKGEIRLLAGSRLAMKWIASHLDVQLDHPVILPLRAQDSDGRMVVPFFGRCWDRGDRRCLYLCGLAGGAGPGGRWLVLRKRPSVTG